jgi:hypothetical protein
MSYFNLTAKTLSFAETDCWVIQTVQSANVGGIAVNQSLRIARGYYSRRKWYCRTVVSTSKVLTDADRNIEPFTPGL